MKIVSRNLKLFPGEQFSGKVRVRVEPLSQYGRPMRGGKSFTLEQAVVQEVYEFLRKAVVEEAR